MPRTELALKTTTMAGVDIGAGTNIQAADDGMFINDGHTILKVVNGADAVRTFDVVCPLTVGADALAVSDYTVTITNSATRYVGPFPTGVYNQLTGDDAGKVYIDMTTNDLTFTAVKVAI